jgi:hypothetical protein
MSGKAKTRKTFGSKLKDQQNDNKTLYSLANQGTIMSANNSVVSGGSVGGGTIVQVAANDLNMNTYDINDVDRLKFAVKAGAGDALGTSDYGIEAIYTGTNAYGIKIQIPEASSDTFKIYRGSQEEVSISQAGIVFTDSVAIASGSARKAKLVLAQYDSSTTPATPNSGSRTLFVDGTNSDNLSVKKSDGSVVDLEAGTSGANVNLSNLVANTAVNVNLLPSASGNKNLGSTSMEWATLYLSSGLYFGTDQNSSTLNHSSGLLFNISDDNDWYEFQIDGDRKMSIGDTRVIVDGDFDPDTDDTRDIGNSSTAWKNFYLGGNIYFNDYSHDISQSSTGLLYNVNTGDSHNFQIGGTTEFTMTTTGFSLLGGDMVYSKSAIEIGYQVKNSALTVGSEGSMIHPYISNTENTPSDSDLNGWFGDQNGAVGIQYYSTSGQFRIWIRANGTWAKAFAT